MGTASAMVFKIYNEDLVNAKGATTMFYIPYQFAVGVLLAAVGLLY